MILFRSWIILGYLFRTNVYCGPNRELIPLEAPANLTFIDFDDRDVLIKWDSVDPASVRGTFRGYLIRVWNHALSQVYAIPPDVTSTAIQFFPYSRNFITVAVRNDKYVGPRSQAISFEAPQTEPNMPHLFEHYPLGNHSVLLQWSVPTQPNGVLIGYDVYCAEMRGDEVDERSTIRYFVTGSENLQAKLTGLKAETKYYVQVAGVNCAGEGDRKAIEVELEPHEPYPPSMPSFKYKIDYNLTDKEEQNRKKCNRTRLQNSFQDWEDSWVLGNGEKGKIVTVGSKKEWSHTSCLVNTMIKWIPDVTSDNPGEYFYVKYRIKGDPEYIKSTPQFDEDYMILENFNACVNYEIILIAVDGEYETESEMQETPAIMFMHQYHQHH
ncbi:unnamed protein product [Acanthoscelides obtectus]|uniref:Fibronectin type-III domain-containing protein n=2 Tax=Acanthoscelides obtectus TaxID=200917 RepID=A0A9P0KTI1_ACAOB|nr:unnamed protein product [Acanthoscelides obtectus]CAH2015066.1 unnamed protein product [Acanthoscelides obtectus]CAK1622141.1 Neuroglian [Acanthoscelides obtectus]CAK1622151.1 Neuroglian [Acanthoscelides obtectus]